MRRMCEFPILELEGKDKGADEDEVAKECVEVMHDDRVFLGISFGD